MNKEKNKSRYVDDGHTVYDMSGLNNRKSTKSNKEDKLGITRKEKSAMIRAGYCYYIPRLLLILLAFTITYIILYFWLK